MKMSIVCAGMMLIAGQGVWAGELAVKADSLDQQWSVGGKSRWVKQKESRIGSDVANEVSGAVTPFELPDLGEDAVSHVELTFHVIGSNLGNLDNKLEIHADLLAPYSEAVSSVAISEKCLDGDMLLDNAVEISTRTKKGEFTLSGEALTAFVKRAYADGGAGKYLVLTLVADVPNHVAKYLTVASADHPDSAVHPVLKIVTKALAPAPAE